MTLQGPGDQLPRSAKVFSWLIRGAMVAAPVAVVLALILRR